MADGADGAIVPAPDTLSSTGRMFSTPEMSATAASTATKYRENGLTACVLRWSDVHFIGMTFRVVAGWGTTPTRPARRPPGAGSMD
jgi:hypothetical protein